MRILYGTMAIVWLVACSSKNDQPHQYICTEMYVSEKWNTIVYHSNEWSAYEFFGNNIGLEYRSLNDVTRRSDAEVVVSFFPNPVPEKEFNEMFGLSNAIAEQIADSLGAELKSRILDEGFKEFADRKWKMVVSEEHGSYKDEKYDARKTNYIWHSDKIGVVVKVSVKGGEIEGMAEEIECILNRLVIKGDITLT